MELQLHPKQIEFVNSPANEVFFGGAAGGGKSHVLRAISIIFCMEIPGIQVYLFRRLYKDLLRSHMSGPGSYPMMLREFIDDKLVRIDRSNNEIIWVNNSKIVLAHIQYESDLDNYLSQEIHVALFDEASTFTEKMYRFIRARVRLGGLQVPDKYKGKIPFIGLGSNPRGPMHNYLLNGWVNAAPHGEVFRAPEEDGGMLRQFIPSKLEDNPTLVNNDPSYRSRLLGLGDPDVVKAYADGDWSVVEGQAFHMFDKSVHVVKKFEVPLSWKIKRGFDYGYSAPYSVLWAAISNGESFIDGNGQERQVPKDSIFICLENYGDDGREGGLRKDMAVLANELKVQEALEFGFREVLPGPADNAIFSAEQGPSIAEKMKNNGISWTRSNKKPGSRILGLSLIRSMLHEATKEIPEGPCLYIMDNCKRLIQHLPLLQMDEKTVEDIDSSNQPDHDYDTLRYIVLDEGNSVKLAQVVGM